VSECYGPHHATPEHLADGKKLLLLLPLLLLLSLLLLQVVTPSV
jgi:hypothetical protein